MSRLTEQELTEILDENNKYLCDKCNRMCKAHKVVHTKQ